MRVIQAGPFKITITTKKRGDRWFGAACVAPALVPPGPFDPDNTYVSEGLHATESAAEACAEQEVLKLMRSHGR